MLPKNYDIKNEYTQKYKRIKKLLIVSSIIIESTILYFIIQRVFTTDLISPQKYMFYEYLFIKLGIFT